jgi:hypothetical protein
MTELGTASRTRRSADLRAAADSERSSRALWGRGARAAYACLLITAAACHRPEDTAGEPSPPPPAAASAARPDPCAGGGGEDPDVLSQPLVPRSAGGFCLDRDTPPRTYGDRGTLSMDEVCTTAFDGECEVYKRLGLDRVVVFHYVDGTGAPNGIDVNLSRFKTVDGAYGMFTDRVVAGGDPARATVKELSTAGGAAALSSSNAYVWRGPYLAELTFVSDDAKMTPEAMASANERSTGAIAKAIGERIPASPTLPAAAALLPSQSRLPLGIAYYPTDAPGMSALGPVAVGYYRDGDTRWRSIALVRTDVEAAKAALRTLKAKGPGTAIKGFGDEAAILSLQEASDRAKAEYVAVRKDKLVLAIGDEELVLDPSAAPAETARLELSREDKMARLKEWLASVH